uniref:Uncharacterized protein n=1 Tax=Oryza meridionalis TaxID=40149 RepID=A0A0E0CX80_9ORYZ
MAQPEKVSRPPRIPSRRHLRRRRSIPAASRGVTGGEPPNEPPLGDSAPAGRNPRWKAAFELAERRFCPRVSIPSLGCTVREGTSIRSIGMQHRRRSSSSKLG